MTTHYHPEHSLGAAAFKGAKLVMTRMQQQDMTELGKRIQDTFASRSALNAELLNGVPYPTADILFDREHRIDLGGVHARLMWRGPSAMHTRGDTMVCIEEDRVLFTGDVVMSQRFLAAQNTSSLATWIVTLDELAALQPRTSSPATARLGDATLIARDREFLQAVQSRVARAQEGRQVGGRGDCRGRGGDRAEVSRVGQSAGCGRGACAPRTLKRNDRRPRLSVHTRRVLSRSREVPMKRRLRRQIRALQAFAGGVSFALVVLLSMGLAQPNAPQRIDELTVQRLNVVDANGTLRMVLSNKDRMHPGVMDGKTIDRPRPVAGLLFFNDVGDEVGGLTFTGQEASGRGAANAGLMFDQWKQDQTIGIQYQRVARAAKRRLASMGSIRHAAAERIDRRPQCRERAEGCRRANGSGTGCSSESAARQSTAVRRQGPQPRVRCQPVRRQRQGASRAEGRS